MSSIMFNFHCNVKEHGCLVRDCECTSERDCVIKKENREFKNQFKILDYADYVNILVINSSNYSFIRKIIPRYIPNFLFFNSTVKYIKDWFYHCNDASLITKTLDEDGKYVIEIDYFNKNDIVYLQYPYSWSNPLGYAIINFNNPIDTIEWMPMSFEDWSNSRFIRWYTPKDEY